ncbi:sal-like protein 3 isoform X4 [Mercenaria mercenaria]|uniref:sal-like protein 3 isoform X4 n=1 Tax=Mercenaria mercenaria TaxID=6596 RepID=UPI001E1D8196|nr:sal-like protein 3 isoform X4 [Mercenaria mercenaria]
MAAPDMEVIKDIPGYKVILKAVIKTQIQQLVEQLAAHTDEESVILTASVADGTLSHLGSDSGKGFLEDHEDVKSQFLGFCLKRHHKKKQAEKEKERQQQMLESMQQIPIPAQLGYGPAPRRNPRAPYPRQILPRAPGPGMSPGGGLRSPNIRHEPYPVSRPQRNSTGSDSGRLSMPTTPVKQEPSEQSNDDVSELNNVSQSPSQSVAEAKDDEKSNSSSSTIPNEPSDGITGESSDKQKTDSDLDPNVNVKVEAITESEMELEITGVEPGRPAIPQDWDPNISMGMNFDPNSGAMGTSADMNQGYNKSGRSDFDKSVLLALYSAPTLNSARPSPDKSPPILSPMRGIKHQCEYCSKIFASAFALNMHVRIHTGEKPFECEICGAKFSVKGNMKRHQLSHMNDTIA